MEQLDPIKIYLIAAFHAIGRCISLVLATIVPEKPSRELLEELPPPTLSVDTGGKWPKA